MCVHAVRHIDPGEALCIHMPGQGAPPVFEACRAAAGVDALEFPEDSDEEDAHGWLDAPESVVQLDAQKLEVRRSQVHGVGVFARVDFEAGDVVEVAPVLPLLFSELRHTRLHEYVFGSDFVTPPLGRRSSVVLLPLGLGALYNHDHAPNVWVRRFQHQPFVQAWVALDSVPAGSELFVSYGAGYWAAPWRHDP